MTAAALLALLVLMGTAVAPPGALALSPPDRYVVQAERASLPALTDEVVRGGGRIHHRYRRVLDGFAATMPRARAEALARDPRVRSVTADAVTWAQATQSNPPWGLDRIDQRPTAGNAAYTYDTTGLGVTIFVVDSGMRLSHTDFGGRAVSGYDFVERDADASDCHGHGTHVAGTAGGRLYGAAKEARLVSLRVWGCDATGSFSDMIAALDWAVQHKPPGPSLVNISGAGGAYAPMDEAVARATAAGMPVIVAAMNWNRDACEFSPARAPAAVTVGAIDGTDTRASFSNFGSCLDIWAPGVGVLSAVNTSDTASAHWSGTSMATPHVSGAAARYLQRNPSATPAQVTAALLSSATADVVKDALSAANDLLYAPPESVAPQVTATAPAASATGVSRAADVTVTFSEPMDRARTQAAFSLVRTSDRAPVAGAFSWSGNTMTFNPGADLALGMSYTATVTTAARDVAGNALATAKTWSFTTASSTVTNLVANPSFESSLSGWGPVQATLSRTALSGAPQGSYVARVAWASGTSFAISDGDGGAKPTVASTTAGRTYIATAAVRAATSASVGKPVQIVLRERNASGATVKETRSTATLGSAFATIAVAATASASGNTLGVRLVQTSAASGHAFFADLVTLRIAGPVMGTSTAGSSWTGLTANAKRVSRFSFTTPTTVDIAHLRAYVDGRATTSGSQPVRAVIYADASGAPGSLLARTGDVVIAAGRAPGWLTFAPAAPVRLRAGTYWLGLHSGGPAIVGRFAAATAAGALRANTDTYTDGPSNPFGTPATDNLQMSIHAVGA